MTISFGVLLTHGLRTPNEGINQRNLKTWEDVADKICFGRTFLEVGVDFRPCSEGHFLTRRPESVCRFQELLLRCKKGLVLHYFLRMQTKLMIFSPAESAFLVLDL